MLNALSVAGERKESVRRCLMDCGTGGHKRIRNYGCLLTADMFRPIISK